MNLNSFLEVLCPPLVGSTISGIAPFAIAGASLALSRVCYLLRSQKELDPSDELLEARLLDFRRPTNGPLGPASLALAGPYENARGDRSGLTPGIPGSTGRIGAPSMVH
jgi:hypothetical protein